MIKRMSAFIHGSVCYGIAYLTITPNGPVNCVPRSNGGMP